MKRYLFILIGCCLLFACTKEGLPGPQGPEGPEGPQGEAGIGGGAGGGTNIITVVTPVNQTTYSWEFISRSGYNATYRFKWKTGTLEGYTFKLPDSLTAYIDDGALLVYAFSEDDRYNGAGMFQVAYAPVDFYDLRTYTCQLEKIAGRYSITLMADMQDYSDPGSPDAPKPTKLTFLKFVIIPNTETGTIGWG